MIIIILETPLFYNLARCSSIFFREINEVKVIVVVQVNAQRNSNHDNQAFLIIIIIKTPYGIEL